MPVNSGQSITILITEIETLWSHDDPGILLSGRVDSGQGLAFFLLAHTSPLQISLLKDRAGTLNVLQRNWKNILMNKIKILKVSNLFDLDQKTRITSKCNTNRQQIHKQGDFENVQCLALGILISCCMRDSVDFGNTMNHFLKEQIMAAFYSKFPRSVV